MRKGNYPSEHVIEFKVFEQSEDGRAGKVLIVMASFSTDPIMRVFESLRVEPWEMRRQLAAAMWCLVTQFGYEVVLKHVCGRRPSLNMA